MEDPGSTGGNSQPVPAEPVDVNLPETSGTTLPLLSGLLAGFAVTTIVQLMLNQPREDLSAAVVVAIAAFLLAVICFINAIVFAIKAQASNYLPFLDLSPSGLRLLNVRDAGAWMRLLERRWFTFFVVALLSFYAGTALFLLALDIIVWVFVGRTVGIVFLAAAVVMVASAVLLDTWVSRRTGSPQHPHSTAPD